MEIGQAASELHGRRHALEKSRQLLNRGQLRVVVVSRGIAFPVSVDQLFGSREGELLIAGITFSGKVLGPSRELENVGTFRIRDIEIRLIVVPLIGIVGNLAP